MLLCCGMVFLNIFANRPHVILISIKLTSPLLLLCLGLSFILILKSFSSTDPFLLRLSAPVKCHFSGLLTQLTVSSHFIVIIFNITSFFLVSENKPPSVVSVRMAFIGTLNLPTHFILTTFHIIYHLLVGQLLLFINAKNYKVYSKVYWSLIKVTEIRQQIFFDYLNQYTRNRP